jgi:hypothetical protein
MSKKIIGIFVMMLMIATTILPFVGVADKSVEKNIVLNQNNKTKPMIDYPAVLIGTINSKVIGESYTSFHTVYVICISKNWGNHIPYANNVLISVSNEYIGYLGEGFIFGIFYGMPPP